MMDNNQEAQKVGNELQQVNEAIVKFIADSLKELFENWKDEQKRSELIQNLAKQIQEHLNSKQKKQDDKEKELTNQRLEKQEESENSFSDSSLSELDIPEDEEEDGFVSHLENDYSYLYESTSTSTNSDKNPTPVNLNKEDSYDLSIEKDGKVIYAQNENHEELKGELSQSYKQGVYKAIDTPIGKTTELSSLKIKEKGKVVLETDNNGKVTVNKSNEYQGRLPGEDAVQIAENKTEQLNSNSVAETQQLLTALIEQVKSLSEKDKQEESTKQLNQGDFYSSGSFQSDKNSSEMNENIKKINEKYDIIIQALQEREKDKRNPNWFSQTANELSALGENIASQFTGFGKDARAAKVVRNLIDEAGKDTYHANNYTIKKQGRFYTLTDSKGKELLDFKVTAMGVKVLDNKLQKNNYRDLEILQEKLKTKDTNLGNFTPYGRGETLKEERLSTLMGKITNYSILRKKSITIEGQNYRWTATPNGDIQINSRGKSEPILLKTGNKVINRMSDRDLAYFEERFQSRENSSQVTQEKQQSQQSQPVLSQPAPTNNVVPINQAKSKQKSKGIEL